MIIFQILLLAGINIVIKGPSNDNSNTKLLLMDTYFERSIPAQDAPACHNFPGLNNDNLLSDQFNLFEVIDYTIKIFYQQCLKIIGIINKAVKDLPCNKVLEH